MTKRSTAAIALPLLVIAGTLSAAEWTAKVGYTTVNLQAFRTEREEQVKNNPANHAILKNDLPGGGLFLTTGLDFRPHEVVHAGFDVGYFLLGKTNYNTQNTDVAPTMGDLWRQEMEGEFTLIPVMARVGFRKSPAEKGLYWGAGLGLGYGFGSVNGTSTSSTVGSADSSASFGYRGQGFVGDLNGSLGYETARIRVGASLAYRMASFSEFNSTMTSPGGGVREGDPIRNSKGENMVIDLSGVQGNLEFAVKF